MLDLLTDSLLDTSHTIAAPLFSCAKYPWEVLPELREFVLRLGEQLSPDEYYCISECVWVAKSAKVAPTASVTGPAIICPGAEIRHCAYIRGSVIVGRGAVVGNSCELKNSIIFDGAQVPHFNYVGDSIVGHLAHLGAGAITSNVKSDKSLVRVHKGDASLETGLKKLGAIIGDRAEIGCGCVLNPGAIIGRGSNIYPLVSVRGTVPPGCIMKGENNIIKKR